MTIKYVVLSDQGERLQDVMEGWEMFNAKGGQLVVLAEAENLPRKRAVELYGLHPVVTSDAPEASFDPMTHTIGEVKTEIENYTFIIYLGVTPLPASQVEENAKAAAAKHLSVYRSKYEVTQLMRDTATLLAAKRLKADSIVRGTGKTAAEICDEFYSAMDALGAADDAEAEFQAASDKLEALAALKAALPLGE